MGNTAFRLGAILAIASWSLASRASGQSKVFASPAGQGTACTEAAPCSLTGARDKVRTLNGGMTADITVTLRGGTYVLDATFVLEPRDSGKGPHRIHYQAASGESPVLSGGRILKGWSLHDPGKGIWIARVDTALATRQLYVNGRRAVRAKGPDNPAGFTKTAQGFTAPDSAMARFANPSDMEVVSLREWKSFRCGIAAISGRDVQLKNPCWERAQSHAGWAMDKVSWIENAFELLDEEGEWYLDRSAGRVYYKPMPGEDMASAEIVAPRVEILVAGRGTAADPVRNLTFKGLTFAHATWLKPGTDAGYPDIQGTYTQGSANPGVDFGGGAALFNVNFKGAENVRFDRNRFTHLGGNALGLDAGSRDCQVVGNVFRDISGNGLHISDITPNPTDARWRVQRITVENNYFTQVGQEYHGCAAIFAGYVEALAIRHNEIFDVPHMGISVGWGWGTASYAKDNEIAYNLVHHLMKRMHDGGGVYTLSPQPGTTIHHNYIHHQRHELGALYPDEGTRYTRWHHNVVESVVRWLHVWTSTISDNTIDSNYHDNPTMTNQGVNNTLVANAYVTGGNWPPEARAIMAGAGLQAAYRDIATPVGMPRRPSGPGRIPLACSLLLRPGGLWLDWKMVEDLDVQIYGLGGARTDARTGLRQGSHFLPLPPGVHVLRLESGPRKELRLVRIP